MAGGRDLGNSALVGVRVWKPASTLLFGQYPGGGESHAIWQQRLMDVDDGAVSLP